MKQVNFYPKGTTVYYFSGFDFKLKETIVENISINVPDVGEPAVTYTLDGGNRGSLKLDAALVYDDRDALKEKVLGNFESKDLSDVKES